MIKRPRYYIFLDKNGKELYRKPLRGRLRKDALPFVWGHYSIILLSKEAKTDYNKTEKPEKMDNLEAMAEKAVEEAKRAAGVYG